MPSEKAVLPHPGRAQQDHARLPTRVCAEVAPDRVHGRLGERGAVGLPPGVGTGGNRGDPDDLDRRAVLERSAVSVVVRDRSGGRPGLRRRRPRPHPDPRATRGDADQQDSRRPLHQTMQVHGSRSSFDQCSDRCGNQTGHGPARCMADRRRHRRLLPGSGDGRRGPVGGQGGTHRRDCRRQAATRQPVAQPKARPGQPGLDRPDRAAKPLGGLLVGKAFQVTEQDRQSESFREPAKLLVELRPGLRPVPIAVVNVPDRHRHLRASTFAQPASGSVEPRPGRDPHGDAIEPARDRVRPPDRTRLPGQHQEDRLRRVLGVVTIPEDPPADVEHHRAVPLHQHGERRLGLIGRPAPEPIQ